MTHQTTQQETDSDATAERDSKRGPAAAQRDSRPAARKRGFRRGLLIRFVILLSLTLVVSILVTRSILLNRVEARIQTRLVDEVQEVHLFAANAPPTVNATYRQHVRELFASLLPIDPPGPGEANITFVDGQMYLSSPEDPPYLLDQDPAAIAAWANVKQPTTGTLDTPAGPVDYRAEPVSSGDGSRGVYVVAVFRELAQSDVDQAMAAAVVVAIAALLVGSLLAWTTTGRMLRPVAAVTRAARTITETDLTKRIPVEGDEEIATLARTFNDMLDRLEAAFHSQRAFLDDAGHELRTPITVITGQLELLEDDPAQRAATMTLVMGELDRMARIVNDLLLLAKAQQPDLLRLDTVNVADLTDELFAKVRRFGDRAWEFDGVGKGVIVADRQRLTEAVIQLAENAVKHTEAGTLRIGSAVGGGFARFWVRDSGRGIPAEEQARLFDRFSRGQGQSRAEGSGLGLTIVKAIADAHHGHVEIDSAPGRGSTFTVVLPVDQPLPNQESPQL